MGDVRIGFLYAIAAEEREFLDVERGPLEPILNYGLKLQMIAINHISVVAVLG